MPNKTSYLGDTPSAKLSDALKQAREIKQWSQMELSRRSGVAPRTIVSIETGKGKRYRQGVLVRLAKSLDQDAVHWLRLAGHGEVSKETVESMIRQSGKFGFLGETDPMEVLGRLETQLAKRHVLMCVAFPSVPGAMHREDVLHKLAGLFKLGKRFCLALTCPFPQFPDIRTAAKMSLAVHYQEIYSTILELGRELRSRMEKAKWQQIAVFAPAWKEIHYVMPLAGLTEYRPILVKYFPEQEPGEPNFELATWVTFKQENIDRWHHIYPSVGAESEDEKRFQKFLCWRDYFSEMLRYCDPGNKEVWGKANFKGTAWEMVDSVEGSP
jgi:transcriptional regulator with XRE-family HTH domain